MSKRIAVVLFNLGGPDRAEAVQPFLQNLFSDPAILRVPVPVRAFLARLISRTRAPSVKKNYALMNAPGGGSPLLPETERQGAALVESVSGRLTDDEVRCFVAMRYWHPFTEDTAADVAAWEPDEVVLLPLYPQYSSTTTGSSLSQWNAVYKGSGHVRTLCCYPFNSDFIDAHAGKIMEAWEGAGRPDRVTLLMSAHGLPERVVKDGDPYQWQVETMAQKLADRLPEDWEKKVCYQSRVGPLKWIGPATEDVIKDEALENRHMLVAPIAFVSDHIETLVELGEEYREIAEDAGAPGYTTVPALGTDAGFISALSDELIATLEDGRSVRSCAGGRLCPAGFGDCPISESPQ